MVTRTLGRTGLDVTQLGYGAMELRGPKTWSGRDVSEEDCERILNAVLDAGINFIDTAYDYGLSEERIGRHISSRRNEYFLATKCGCDPRDRGDHIETVHTWTRDNLLRNIEGSLERMKTDHVDILQLHNPSPDDVVEGGLIDALKEIQERKLTRFVGISTTLPDLVEYVPPGVFDTFQIPYSCLQPVHHEAISQAADSGAGIIIRGGIARGGPAGELALPERTNLWKAAELDELCGDVSPSNLILRYTLTHPHCDTTIVGTLNEEHLAANLVAAAAGPLDGELYNEITRRVQQALQR